jgi:hypothetical protein
VAIEPIVPEYKYTFDKTKEQEERGMIANTNRII